MEEGVTENFKSSYQQIKMRYLVSESVDKDRPTTKELRKNYNIKMAIENIAFAWREVGQTTMNGVWIKLLPE
jgi:hypothetical protein